VQVIPLKSQQPSPASNRRGPGRERDHDQDRARAAGLRRVAAASVAALAAVLWFAVATAGSGHGPVHRGNAVHSAEHATGHARTSAGDD
jgi:hypothetical protein